MFDGIVAVALAAPALEPLLHLYGEQLGFRVSDDDPADDQALREVLGWPDTPGRTVRLSKGDDVGGSLLLVESSTAVGSPVRLPPAHAGPLALDFYLRDLDRTESDLSTAGWHYSSPAVDYSLPGTTLPVRERMLRQDSVGLLHALVQHRPGGTRSVLGTDAAARCSEVVALVVVTADLDGARDFAHSVLGAEEYFHGVFDGPAMEEMLRFAPGHGLEATLFRGPTSANARLEFARPVDAAGSPTPLTGRGPSTALAALIEVDSIEAVRSALAGTGHGTLHPPRDVRWAGGRRRAARLETAYDLTLCLLERPRP